MTGIRSTRIFQLAGEAWRQMSLEEKQPYLNAAKTIKNQKEKQHKNEHVTKSTTNTEIKKNKIAKKQTRSSKEIKRPNKVNFPLIQSNYNFPSCINRIKLLMNHIK